jgi:hypothetical protein
MSHDRVNAAARRAPGFVWRLQDDLGGDGGVHAFDWDAAGTAGIVVNLSVWQDVESLESFTYGQAHRSVLARRRAWFHPMPEANSALWWIASGTTPTPAEAEDRVRHLRAYGPSVHAFTLQVRFNPPADLA